MSNAFGTLVRIYFVYIGTHINGVVRAFRLAHVAIDAPIGNDQSHCLPKKEDLHAGSVPHRSGNYPSDLMLGTMTAFGPVHGAAYATLPHGCLGSLHRHLHR